MILQKVIAAVDISDIGPEDIDSLILDALADVRVCDLDTLLEERLANGGNLEITAKERHAVIAILEDKLKTGPLITPKDLNTVFKHASCLCPAGETTLNELRDAMEDKIRPNT